MYTKLTVRVPKKLLENAKRYAKVHNTTVTVLVASFLERIPADMESLDNAPTVLRLTGILPPDVSIKDYKEHLEEKYG